MDGVVKRNKKPEPMDNMENMETIKEVELPVTCNAPAPLVVNGAPYCGCQLQKDHDGRHEVYISWER